MKRSGEPPLTVSETKESRAGKFFRGLCNAVFNLASLVAGGILIYAGSTRRVWGEWSTTALIAGGLILVIYAVCRQFDRR